MRCPKLLVFGANADVYAVERRGLCLVLRDEYVTTTCRRDTAALFLPSQVLIITHPVLPPPTSSALLPVRKWCPPEMMLPRRGQSGRLPARAEDDEVQATPPVPHRPSGHGGTMRDRSPATQGLRGARAPTAAHKTPDKVRSQRSCLLYTSPSPRD